MIFCGGSQTYPFINSTPLYKFKPFIIHYPFIIHTCGLPGRERAGVDAADAHRERRLVGVGAEPGNDEELARGAGCAEGHDAR